MATEDMSQYLGVFLDEANEQLEILERTILALEHEATPELLQEIFRAAHTLKGSSRAMGFTSMGELTHALEDVFDRLRHNELAVTRPIIDALFGGVDLLSRLKDEIADTGQPISETDVWTARLRAIMESEVGTGEAQPAAALSASEFDHAPLTETAQVAVQDALLADNQVYALSVDLAHDCAMKSVRAMMVLQVMETVGSILATIPDEAAIENEQFDFSFGLVVATEHAPEELVAKASGVSEVVRVTAQPYATSAPHRTTEQHSTTMQPSLEMPDQPPAALEDERLVDLGPEARGKPPVEQQALAQSKAVVGGSTPGQTIRVDVNRLDNLLNLVGELVIDQTRIAELTTRTAARYAGEPLLEDLYEAAVHFGRITSEIQEEIMKARMLPIDNVFNRFPRMIRDLAHKLGKEVEFIVTGRETELDRSVIEVLGDPLIHLLRNSVDHGIEAPADRIAAGKPATGTVWLRARHEENHIVIEIEDDGRGIDPDKMRRKAIESGLLTEEAASRMSDREAMNLIFASGFSTASVVTDVSGRGVGMDIVRSNLTRFGSVLDFDSKVGRGCKLTIKLPLTLAIIRALLVKVASGVYAIPLSSIVETIRIPASGIHVVNHREVIIQRGLTLPLARIRTLFYGCDPRGIDPDSRVDSTHYVVVVGVAERQMGLVVDALLGEQEIVIKSLGKFVGDIQGISGATLLGDGSIALIVDVNAVFALVTEEKAGAYAA